MGRILAIDYGEKRIGLAISDEEQKFSFELDIWSPREFSENIKALLAERNIERIVLGHPLGMSGQKTAKTAEVEKFKEDLEKTAQIPVELFDERLTSKMAGKISGDQKNIDSLAAQIILENYLSRSNGNS